MSGCPQKKKFVETSKKLQKNGNYNFSHSALFHIKLEFFKNIFSMVVFGNVIFWKRLLTFSGLIKLYYFKVFDNYEAWTLFHPKIRAPRKVLNFLYLDSYFSNLFSEVKNWYLTTLKFTPGRSFRKIKLIPPEISQFLNNWSC